MDKDDQKEGLSKKLENIEKSQNSNTNNKSKPSSVRNELSFYFSLSSNARSKSSKKTSISDDKLERSIYFSDVANMQGIILESKMKHALLLNI